MVSLNRNIYGRNQDEVYEVSLSNALYITDGTIETYTFPIETIDSLTKYNLMLSLKNGEYQPYIVHYDLTDEEYTAYLEGNLLDLSEKTTVSILQNNEISITDRYNSNPETNGCFKEYVVNIECNDHYGVNNHCYMNDCDGRDSYTEIHEVPCVTNGGGGNGDGGNGGYTPGTPPGPGSPGGTYSGPSGSDGSPAGYTGFVIGDGGTGNQDDVDAINQVTQEMDAAFGVGNWSFNDNPSDNVPEYSSVQEFINDNLGLTSNHSDFQIELDQISNINRIVRGKLRLMRYTNSGLKFTLQIENINEINMDINENLSSIINYGPESNYFSFYPDNSNNIFEGPYAFYEQSLRYNVYGVVKREWKIANNITLPLVINIPIHIQIIISNVTGEVISTSWDYNW
ncbi:hypothetical protein NMK71_00715 [Weeksellaceae bacterium KMM 9713]|uniref:Uncharacterized protein n=1 Tax=Profundicola chukchiensis TaxID=2961959 RepID=A0A9X4RWU5_9FLAO|nr:hypothetical protein [Profundicola chukchiensis]MDG4944924.1 hypothetical protein [Profundicola chukchiensis]